MTFTLFHGNGHLEKVYENALAHRLRKAGLDVKQQYPLQVHDEDGTLIGDYFADLLVEDMLIIELKTAKVLGVEHEAQVLGYLKSARREHGLLINFGSPRFEMRKFVWTHGHRIAQPQRAQRTHRAQKKILCSLWLKEIRRIDRKVSQRLIRPSAETQAKGRKE